MAFQRPFSFIVALFLAFSAEALSPGQLHHGSRGPQLPRRQSGALEISDDGPPLILVPQYNISMPVDHFNTSDTRVFDVRFWVNDTYYKPGGPVIYWDFGEQGVTDREASQFLAGWNGTVSASLQVAKALDGVVVGMEHRYYGLSHPFPLNLTYDITESGVPIGGAADYKYLTLEQALEDSVYLARSFDRIQLTDTNNTILSGQDATAHLGPSDTPWIFIGGSYPGNRAVWSRLRTPEVWFAAWASSAPLQSEPTMSAYYNTIYRGIPRNCSADIQAAVNAVDKILLGDDQTAKQELKRMIFLAESFPSLTGDETPEDIDIVLSLFSDTDIAQFLAPISAFILVQNSGIHSTIQKHCDWMEHFNTKAYLSNVSQYPADSIEYLTAALYNPDNANPLPGGISSCRNSPVTIAAYLYALAQDVIYYEEHVSEDPSDLSQVGDEDIHGWAWQELTQLGFLGDSGDSANPLRLTSTLLNQTWGRAQDTSLFEASVADSVPPVPDTSYALSFGGWHATPSNTMITGGEFDPWRAYSVYSLEQDFLGAPLRRATEEVPACNQPPEGTNVFGVIYGGACHIEDMAYYPGRSRGSEGTPPVYIGTELFLKALAVWLPCFKGTK